MAGEDEDENPDLNPCDTLHVIASRIEDMEKRVNKMMDKLDFVTSSIKEEDWLSAAKDAMLFHTELMEIVRNLHQGWALYCPRGKKMSALIVDSHTANCLLYRSVLSRPPFNMEIDEVSSGEDVIRTPAERVAKYNLIIVNRDLSGIDGATTARRLSQEVGWTTVILGINVLEFGETCPSHPSPKSIEFMKHPGTTRWLNMHKFSGSVLLIALGKLASKEVGDYVKGEVQKVIDVVNDFEFSLGIYDEPHYDTDICTESYSGGEGRDSDAEESYSCAEESDSDAEV